MAEQETVYFTHNNGGRPFKVIVQTNKVVIQERNTHEPFDYTPFKIIDNPIKIFTGKDSPNFNEGNNVGDHHHVDGNTILIRISNDSYKYIYIGGSTIYEFIAKDEITDYFSPIGFSDVPYPYAVTDTRIYIMQGMVTIKKKHTNPIKNPIYEYYERNNKADGFDYITKQLILKDNHEPYDNIIDDNLLDDTSPYYGSINFEKDNAEVIEYKKNKWHINQEDIDIYKKYKDIVYAEYQ